MVVGVMTERVRGKYDSLYAARHDNILWGERPGRLVSRIHKYDPGTRVLDAGCGDGKNALFLESEGFEVTGIDSSQIALNGLVNRFRRAGRRPTGVYQVGDVCEFQGMRGEYDMIVSYGLFHCLAPETRIETHLRLQQLVRVGGIVLLTCLLDSKALPEEHGTPDVVLVQGLEIARLFDEWALDYLETGEISEDHLPVIGSHTHSAIWLAW